MIRILILDNEKYELKMFSNLITQHNYQIIGLEDSYEVFLRKIQIQVPDIIIFNPTRYDETFFTFLKHSEHIFNAVPCLFLIEFPHIEFLKNNIHFNSYQYLIKPFVKNQLFEMMQSFDVSSKLNQKAKSLSSENFTVVNDVVFLKDKDVIDKIPYNDILWIKSGGNYVEVHTKNSMKLVRAKISDVYLKLDHKLFYKTHKSHIINLKQVSKIDSKFVTIENQTIPVSKNFIQDLKERLLNL